jgi:thiol:disulfide interchange protein DsbC
MIKRILYTVMVIGMSLGISSSVLADEQQDIKKITSVLSKLMPKAKPDSIKPAVIPGMYEAVFGPQVVYVSKDGRYVLEGDLYDLTTRTNLTDIQRRSGREKVISSIDPSTMIDFAPKKVKYTITAFTDIDCAYCRKLHKHMADYNKLGIEFRYMSFPRSGVNTPSFYKAVSVWCAKDRKKAITDAKNGESLKQIQQIAQVKGKDCRSIILNHMQAAKEVGVNGTPTLVLSNGQVIPGYVEPQRLIKILDQIQNTKS